MRAEGHALSPEQLKEATGFTSLVGANQIMGAIGTKVLAELGTHPEGLGDGKFQKWTVIAVRDDHADGSFARWALRPEVVKALSEAL